jgi:hypothetical protein
MRSFLFALLSFLLFAACSNSDGVAKTADGGNIYTSAPPTQISCSSDSDCCVAVDECHSVAYVVHAGDELDTPQTGCNLCLAPQVQVWCGSNGTCQSAALPSSEDAIATNHCGQLADAGTSSGGDSGAYGCQ